MTGSFAQAVARRSDSSPSNEAAKSEHVVVDPRDGTILDLANHPHEQLVDVLRELRRRETQLKEWRTAVEDELVRRHGDRRAAQVVGDHEVDVDRGYSRVWDAEDLDAVVQHLVEANLLPAVDVAGLLKLETKVDGRKAQALLNRATDDALVELRRCFRWEMKGRAKVKVTPVVSLDQAQVEGEGLPSSGG